MGILLPVTNLLLPRVVLEPWVPMAASIKIVPRSRVRNLDADFGEVAAMLSRWGAGAGALLSRS